VSVVGLLPDHQIGRFLITTTQQAAGAPRVDGGRAHSGDGRHYGVYTILLTPWRRTAHGERPPQIALVVGWQNARVPQQPHSLLTRSRRPRLRRIGAWLR
jgi:hypothetical protein